MHKTLRQSSIPLNERNAKRLRRGAIAIAPRFYLWAALLMALVGCAGAPSATQTPPPTLTLIPATPTATATPAQPTPTLPSRVDIDALFAATASPTPQADIRGLVSLAISDLAAALAVAPAEIALVEVNRATWRSLDFGCGEEPPPPVALSIMGYRLVLQVQDTLYAYHTDARTVRRCERFEGLRGELEVVLEVDPVAQELALLAQRRVANTLDVPMSQVQVVSVRAYQWQDMSLGCPLPNETYAPASIDGYRIVLEANGQQQVFHTNAEQVFRCRVGQ